MLKEVKPCYISNKTHHHTCELHHCTPLLILQCEFRNLMTEYELCLQNFIQYVFLAYFVCSISNFQMSLLIFIVGECILLRMNQIGKYRQPSFATVL
jgi:hypothetical protein